MGLCLRIYDLRERQELLRGLLHSVLAATREGRYHLRLERWCPALFAE
jgi:hypothetical protein